MERRQFLLCAATAAHARVTHAANRVNVAVIGLHGRGKRLAQGFAGLPDVGIEYLVDVDESVIPAALKSIGKQRAPKVVTDMRRVFDDKNVDAVAIATPDHWHAPAAILACDSGKDVYVEKPCSHNIREGRLMVEAARRNRRVVQHGTQARSRESTQRAIEYAASGKIGKVLMAKAWNVQMRKNLGHKPDSAPPAGVDYETWTGPAKLLPFNENRFHYNWHWHWNYGTGDIGNDGAHQLDQARWALGVELPSEISGLAGKLYFDDDQITPDTMTIAFRYPGKMLLFEMRIWNPYALEGMENGVGIYGSEGMVQIGKWDDGTAFKVFDRKGEMVHSGKDQKETHQANFIECVRSRKRPNADLETVGFPSAMLCHLGNIVARTGRTLRFDGASYSIPGDAEANGLVRREYRPHWGTPKGV